MNLLERLINLLSSLFKSFRGRPKRSPQKVHQKYFPPKSSEPPKKIFTPPPEEKISAPEKIFEPEEDFFAPPPEEKIFSIETFADEPREKIFVLDIHDAEELENYFARLQNFDSIKNFSSTYHLRWAETRLADAEKVLKKIRAMNDFEDGEFNFRLACKVRDIAGYMLEIFTNAKDSPSLDLVSRTQLRDLVEEYLSGVGLVQKKFSPGDSYDDWVNLSMKEPAITVSTAERALHFKIVSVEVQPHVINYRDERGETEQLIFGGLCKIYKFKEG